ncbi:MAG: DUF4831 family protein [Bacteroidales bacterium]|nr:DUF4831 family protein [Bacteroidales bacterium]
MKKLLLALLVLFSLNEAAVSQEGGVVYYLPRTVIQVELTVEETNYIIGPYSEYASSLLGLTNYVRENKTETKIIGADILTGIEADPDAMFVMAQQDEKSKEPLPNVIMNEDGIVLAVGCDNYPLDLKAAKINYKSDCQAKADDVTFIDIIENIEDEEGDGPKKKLTKEEKANLAVEQIRKLRNSYYEMISGFQEVAFGDATKFMAESLKSLENEYLSLFKGKVVKRIYNKVVYFTPEKSQANANTVIYGGKNDQVKIVFDSKNAMTNVEPLGDEIMKTPQANKVFYRIPASSNVKIVYDNKTLAEKRLVINQFGEVQVAPVKNNKLLFNPNTGQIISNTK